RTCAIKRALHGATESIGAKQPKRQSAAGECQSFSEELKTHSRWLRTERHAEPDLRCPLRDREGHDAVDAQRREQERKGRESTVERDVQPIGCHPLAHDLLHRLYFRQRQVRVDRTDRRREAWPDRKSVV